MKAAEGGAGAPADQPRGGGATAGGGYGAPGTSLARVSEAAGDLKAKLKTELKVRSSAAAPCSPWAQLQLPPSHPKALPGVICCPSLLQDAMPARPASPLSVLPTPPRSAVGC